MLNNFSNKTRELFFFVYNCWECGQNRNHELHHILGRVSDSPYNAALLCHGCHAPDDGDPVHTEEKRALYLYKTKVHLDTLGYKPNVKDEEFLKENKKYYDRYAD